MLTEIDTNTHSNLRITVWAPTYLRFGRSAGLFLELYLLCDTCGRLKKWGGLLWLFGLAAELEMVLAIILGASLAWVFLLVFLGGISNNLITICDLNFKLRIFKCRRPPLIGGLANVLKSAPPLNKKSLLTEENWPFLLRGGRFLSRGGRFAKIDS